MSRSRYRRNGTPIGDHRVYALTFRGRKCSGVYEIERHGVDTYEDVEALVELEQMTGKFGHDHDRLVITQPGVNLSKLDLPKVDLSHADLRDAVLIDANLTHADLRGADLRGADLRKADLTNADLSEANLSGANLQDAILINAYFYKADLSGADLTGAYYPHETPPRGWKRGHFYRLFRA